jgi:hypothetical protein
MIKHWLTDDTGMILAVYTEDSYDLAMKQGKALAKSFSESEIYLHSGSFADGTKLEAGMGSSMRGSLIRIYKDNSTATVDLFSGYSTSQRYDSMAHSSKG